MNNPLSNCCHAEMKVEGHTTHYYVCLKCGKPCDVDSNVDYKKEARNG